MLAPRPPPPPPPPPGWYPDWQRRVDRLKAAGLPVVVQGLQVAPNGFLALQLQADDAVLPRSNRDRGFPLHISIGMLHHYPPEAISMARRFAARWQGRPHVLPIEWVGVGGAAMVRRADPLVSDPDFLMLHRNSWYADRQPHVSL